MDNYISVYMQIGRKEFSAKCIMTNKKGKLIDPYKARIRIHKIVVSILRIYEKVYNDAVAP